MRTALKKIFELQPGMWRRSGAPHCGAQSRRCATIAIPVVAAALLCASSSGQQPASEPAMPKAQQVTVSGRQAMSSGTVQSSQSSMGGGGVSVNTINSTVQITGTYEGSTPDPNVAQGVVSLNIADAIRRGLRFNLGAATSNASVKQLRGERLAALASLLPNIYATLSENEEKIDLQAEGLSANTFGGSIKLPTTVGPFHYYGALANVTESLSMTSLYNLRQSQASADAAEMNAHDARELIILAVAGTYLQVLASKANVVSQEAQVKQAERTFTQSEHQYQAGTQPALDRNKSFVEFHTEQERLSSMRADLTKRTMQLARLIGLPVGQPLALSEDLPAHVTEAISLEEAIKLAFEERNDLKAARLQLSAAQQSHRASVAEYLPSISASGDYGLEGQSPIKGGVSVYQATASVKIPIFESGRVRADVEQADAAVSQRQAEYADEKGIVELDVRNAYIDLQVATEQVAVAQENRKVANETLTQSLDRFANGVTTSVEVVQSQETVASAERDYISSLFSLNLARVSLARATGQAEQFIPNMLKGN